MKAKSSLPHIIKLCFICSVSDGHSLYNSNISRVATKIVECLLIQGRQASVSTTSQLLCTDINDSSTYQRGMEAPIFKMGTSRWSPVMESLCQDAAAKKTPADSNSGVVSVLVVKQWTRSLLLRGYLRCHLHIQFTCV